jgi:hypothetical protein
MSDLHPRPSFVLAASLAAATALAVAPLGATTTLPSECNDYAVPGSCAFACTVGQTVSISMRADLYGYPVYGTADCGSVHITCSGTTSCSNSAVTSRSGAGTCTMIEGDSAYCDAE